MKIGKFRMILKRSNLQSVGSELVSANDTKSGKVTQPNSTIRVNGSAYAKMSMFNIHQSQSQALQQIALHASTLLLPNTQPIIGQNQTSTVVIYYLYIVSHQQIIKIRWTIT